MGQRRGWNVGRILGMNFGIPGAAVVPKGMREKINDVFWSTPHFLHESRALLYLAVASAQFGGKMGSVSHVGTLKTH